MENSGDSGRDSARDSGENSGTQGTQTTHFGELRGNSGGTSPRLGKLQSRLESFHFELEAFLTIIIPPRGTACFHWKCFLARVS